MDASIGDRPPAEPPDPTEPPTPIELPGPSESTDASVPADLPAAHLGGAGDAVSRAAHVAIHRAKTRRDPEVTPDDLLVALLDEVSRFGVARIGPWSIEVEAIAGDPEPVLEAAASDGGSPRPRYADATVALFERAAAIAGRDGSPTTRLVHLLAAFSDEEGLMDELREAHGFTSAEWRAALAAMDPPLGLAAPSRARGAGRARVPELLSVDDAAEFLGVHAQTVRNYIRSGKLPAYRLAGERFIRVLRRDLLALLERVQVEDAPAAPMPG